MKKILVTVFLLSAFGLNAPAQHLGRSCGTVDYNQYLEERYPEVRMERQRIEEFTARYREDFEALGKTSGKSVVVIPVVVHVIYHQSYPAQNIPYSRVVEQIDVLNKDFSATNADTSGVPGLFKGDVADTEIRFCLASRDPNGNWTNGVTYTQTTQVSFSMIEDANIKSTAMGGQDPWNRNKYMNIWVCNLSGNVLGYAQTPGLPAHLDGLVIGYKYFGKTGAQYPYNLGRTTTHEVGHWLNLIHVWGDDNGTCLGSDFCDDTPNQASDNYGCPAFPHASCSNTSDMFMNFMDYVDDRCMFMFTYDQKARMLAVLNGFRASILSSDGCMPAIGIPEHLLFNEISIYPNPTMDEVNIHVSLMTPAALTIRFLDGLGRELKTLNLPKESGFDEIISLNDFPAGLYFVRLESQGLTEIRKLSKIH